MRGVRFLGFVGSSFLCHGGLSPAGTRLGPAGGATAARRLEVEIEIFFAIIEGDLFARRDAAQSYEHHLALAQPRILPPDTLLRPRQVIGKVIFQMRAHSAEILFGLIPSSAMMVMSISLAPALSERVSSIWPACLSPIVAKIFPNSSHHILPTPLASSFTTRPPASGPRMILQTPRL